MYLLFVLITLTSAAHIPSRNLLHNSKTSNAFRSAFSKDINFGSELNVNENPLRNIDRRANVLRLNKEENDQGYYYGYETSNGIVYQESKSASGSQGSYSYKGDDGETYTIVFTSGDHGFQASGAHIPTPPPVPQEILEALRRNQEDEAKGIFDDGKYDPAKYDNRDYKGSFARNGY